MFHLKQTPWLAMALTVSHPMTPSSAPPTVRSRCAGALLSAARRRRGLQPVRSHLVPHTGLCLRLPRFDVREEEVEEEEKEMEERGRKKKSFFLSRGHGAHNVCSSTAPVFNFRT